MIIIRPFDNWWHNAYSLDVAILSPPHLWLMTGSVAISIGSLILIGGAMNRSEGRQRTMLRGLFLYVGGIVVNAWTALAVYEISDLNPSRVYVTVPKQARLRRQKPQVDRDSS